MAKFVYYNRNPDGEKESDCVTRAISLATGISYPSVRKKLFHSSRLLECEKLSCDCYSHLLENVLMFQPVACRGLTVEEFSDFNPNGVYLIRINAHLTTSIDNSVWDIWDCRNEMCDKAWKRVS